MSSCLWRLTRRGLLCAGAMVTVLALAGVMGASASPVFYGVNNSSLVQIDVGAQTVTTVGALGVNDMADCEFNATGALYGVRQGSEGGMPPTNHNYAYRIDPLSGATVQHGDFGFNTPRSLAYRASNGQFYTVSGLNGQLSTVDLDLGILTSVAGVAHGLPGQWKTDALAFAPDGTLYGMWNAGSDFMGTKDFYLVRFDLTTGLATQIGAAGVNRDLQSLRFDAATGIPYTVDALNGDVLSVNLTTGAGTVVYAGAAPGVTGLAYTPEPAALALLLVTSLFLRRR